MDFVEPDVRVQAFSQVVSTDHSRVGGSLSVLEGSHQQVNVDAGIAIIDTGIVLTHPDLNVFRQVTFVPGTSTAKDDNGHGTVVAEHASAGCHTVNVFTRIVDWLFDPVVSGESIFHFESGTTND